MPLQNRCDPFGDLIAHPARGLFMGNRGGRIHDDAQRLTARRFASKQWICCTLAFKERHRGRVPAELMESMQPVARGEYDLYYAGPRSRQALAR